MRTGNRSTLLFALTVATALFGAKLRANDTLQIDKAYIGITDSWRDLTIFLQDQIESGAVSFNLSQPYKEIGGDPAPGMVKSLVVDYRLNGRRYQLLLKEQSPVGFAITIPSPEAEAPGANPEITALMENISSAPTFRGQPARGQSPVIRSPRGPGPFLFLVITGISLAALVFSVVALVQVRQLRKEANTPPVIH